MIATFRPFRSCRLALIASLTLAGIALSAAAADDAPKAKPAASKANEKKAEQPNVRKKLAFEDFDLVVKRNIFDPDRKKYVPPVKQAERKPAPPPRNSIVLKGTMKIDKVQFASFDSSLSDYRGRFNRDADIGEFKLTNVTATNATLKLSTNNFILRVGEGLSRTGKDPWTASGASDFSSGASFVASRSRSSSTGSSASSSSSSSPAPTGEVKMSLIERMKARRAKAAAEGK